MMTDGPCGGWRESGECEATPSQDMLLLLLSVGVVQLERVEGKHRQD